MYESVVRAIKEQLSLRTNDISTITAEQIAELRHLPRVQWLGARLQAANDTLLNWHRPPEMPRGVDGTDTPRGLFQASVMRRIVEHSQEAPFHTHDKNSPYRDGLLTVAPPGAGKTLLEALVVNYAGTGLPISEQIPLRRTALGILHSNVLIRQCLDPDGDLQRFVNVGGRSVRIGAYYKDRRDGHDEYDLLLTTPESYETAVRKGAVQNHTTVRYTLDEAHRIALAPSMQEHIASFGSGLYMFTATPAIAYGRRDLRQQFPHSQFGSMREFVEDGILSPIQLFTYRAGPEADSAANIAISQAADLLRSGRKTLIVCQPGEQLRQARQIANKINDLYKHGLITPHTRFDAIEGDEIACVIGSNPTLRTEENIEYVRQGKRLLITSVATGNEGLNIVDLDAVIIIGPQGALWKVDQWLGRVLRPSGRLAVAVEVLPHELRAGKPLASVFHSFDMPDKTIISGHYISPRPRAEAAGASNGELELSSPKALGRLAIPRAADNTPQPPKDTARQAPPELYTPPNDLAHVLVNNVPIREATIAPADLAKMPPPEYRPLDIPLPEGVPEEWLYNMLAKVTDPDIRYIGVWEEDGHGKMQYVRYYSPAAHRYFTEHPIPELVGEAEFLDQEIADMLEVGRHRVQAIIEALGITPLPRITKSHRSPKYYDMETVAKVSQEVEKIPRADETDVPVLELEKELDVYVHALLEKYAISPVDKHRNPAWGLVGVSAHVTEAEAHFLRDIRDSVKEADPELHIGLKEIAERSGMSLGNAQNKFNALSDEQKPLTEWMRIPEGSKLAMFFSRAWGEAFIEYSKPEKVLPWEVSQAMLAKYFGRSKQYIVKLLASHDRVLQPLPGVKLATLFPLSIIPKLVKAGLVPIEGAPPVTPELAAMSPDEIKNTDRIAYSQMVQSYFIPHEHIPAPSEIKYYWRRRHNPPTMPNPALSYKPISPDKKEQPGHTIKTSRLPENSAEKHRGPVPIVKLRPKQTTPPLVLPEGYVNIHQYLAGQGVSCTPNLLLMVARKNQINNKSWIMTNQGPWAPEDDVSTIALAIMEYNIAPKDSGNPEKDFVPVQRIAAEFSGKQTNLSEGDIHKVAVSLLQQRSSAIEALIQPFRVRMPDGSAGALMSHYTKSFADKVRAQLKRLEARKELHTVRRW